MNLRRLYCLKPKSHSVIGLEFCLRRCPSIAAGAQWGQKPGATQHRWPWKVFPQTQECDWCPGGGQVDAGGTPDRDDFLSDLLEPFSSTGKHALPMRWRKSRMLSASRLYISEWAWECVKPQAKLECLPKVYYLWFGKFICFLCKNLYMFISHRAEGKIMWTSKVKHNFKEWCACGGVLGARLPSEVTCFHCFMLFCHARSLAYLRSINTADRLSLGKSVDHKGDNE